MVLQADQRNASHEVMLTVSRNGFVPGGMVLISKHYDIQRTINQKIPVAETAFQRDFACQ